MVVPLCVCVVRGQEDLIVSHVVVHMPVIPACGSPKQDDHRFQAILGYTARFAGKEILERGLGAATQW